ncbi:MAG: hypothetical protein ACR2JV_05580 [Gaiellales bacterium]
MREKLESGFVTEVHISACVLDADGVESTRLSGAPALGLRLRRDFAEGTLIAIVRQSDDRVVVITVYRNEGDRRGRPSRRSRR